MCTMYSTYLQSMVRTIIINIIPTKYIISLLIIIGIILIVMQFFNN